MAVETIQLLSLISFVVAAVLFLVSVLLFFLFNIPKLFGEITGSTARKAIENIRQQNEQTGNKAYRPSPVNAERGKITDRITRSGKLEPQRDSVGVSVGTAKLKSPQDPSGSNETSVLEVGIGETTMLYDESRTEQTSFEEDCSQQITMQIEYELGFTASSEIIE